MKFGKNIGGQQEENNDLHYVEYKLLKKRIKDVVGRLEVGELAEALTANTAFEEELAAEIRQVNSCFEIRQKAFLERIAELSEELQRDGAVALFPSSTAITKGEVGPGEQQVQQEQPAAFRRLVEMLKEVDRFRKYAVWNAVAVVKILKKRRKQTSFGLADSSAERAGWLSRQSFLSGSEFAELHVAIESLGRVLVLSKMGTGSSSDAERSQVVEMAQQCPICLDTISDMVELSCKHRFCWKCFVLGPIAFQPGEYRMSQCPICRRETTKPPEIEHEDLEPDCALIPGGAEGLLSRFLRTYYPESVQTLLENEEHGDLAESSLDVVGELIKVVLADTTWQQPVQKLSNGADSIAAAADALTPMQGRATASSASVPSDFFQTLPPKPSQEDRAQMRAAQKLQWLQLASSNDPLAVEATTYCPLCSEPLLMEAVVTAPCKHHFHKVCARRLESPQCPLCQSALPFSWFLPADHPLVDCGFRVVHTSQYNPHFLGGPSRGCGGFPLHKPPPAELLGPAGISMRSYLHRMPPMGSGEDSTDALRSHEVLESSHEAPQADEASSASESSSEDATNSEDADEDCADDGRCPLSHSRNHRGDKWAYTALGRMRLCARDGTALPRLSIASEMTQATSAPSTMEDATGAASTGLDNERRVLRIVQHL